eukprot:scaffold49887_cov48-Attheya_sp.AAC.2
MAGSGSLFERIGGEPAVHAAVDVFYKRILEDLKLVRFFEGVDMERLKKHQMEFISFAFTNEPEYVSGHEFMMEAHMKLFEKYGLNETHFDLIAAHFHATLTSLGLSPELVDEAVDVVATLRPAFEEGGKLNH